MRLSPGAALPGLAVLAFVGAAVLQGCSKDDPVPTGVATRLVDLKPLSLTGFEQMFATMAGDVAPYFDAAMDALPKGVGIAIDDPFVRVLFAHELADDKNAPEHTTLTLMYFERTANTVRLELTPGPGESPHAFLCETHGPFSIAKLEAPGTAEAVLSGSKRVFEWLIRAPQAKVASFDLTMDGDVTGVIVGVINGPHSRLAISAQSAGAAVLRGSGIQDKNVPLFVRRICSDNDWREALVVPRGGAIRYELTLPTDAATISFGLVRTPETVPSALTGRVRVWTSTTELVENVEAPLSAPEWTDHQVDVALLAGTSVCVEFSAGNAAAGDDGQFLCFANPTVMPKSTVPTRPDVIVVSLDTVRWDRLTVADPALKTSPALAAFAADSVVFENAFCAATWTLPSHAAVFTGMYPDRTSVSYQNSRIPSGCPTMAEEFRAAGYETLAVTGAGFVSPEFGFARGFERYVTCDPGHAELPAADESVEEENPRRRARGARQSEASRAALLARLRQPRSQPLFMFVHTYSAHNYAPERRVLRELGAAEADIPDLMTGVATSDLSRYLQRDPPPPDAERLKKRASFLYDCGVREADLLFADLTDALKASGRLDTSIIVVLADHGEELFEHGDLGHGKTLYDEVLHVPLIMRVPGIAAARSRELVSLVDVLPTVRDLAGIDAASAPAIDGRSLSPVLRGERLQQRPIYASVVHLDTERRALRSGGEKFIGSEKPGKKFRQLELFDLNTDPREQTNRIALDRDVSIRWADALGRFVGTLESSRIAGDRADVSDETRKRLEELGYLGGN